MAELGLEIESDDFKTLLLKTFEQRENVDLKIEMEANRGTVKAMYLLMTYQFSPTICRKGVFRLPIVAADAPPSIVTLLLSFHAVPPHPILSEQQKQEAVKQKVLPAAIMSSARVNDMDTVGVRASNGANAALQQPLATNAITGAVNPVLLKKRRALAGTMRRKGPRGAKLVKK